jgi:hypothetical protein
MKLIVAGLAGLTLALGVAGIASAQDMTPAVKSGPPSVDWPIVDLVADPALKAVVDKDIPGLETNQYYEQIKGMSIRGISKFPQANIDDAKLVTIQADLVAATPASAAAATATH